MTELFDCSDADARATGIASAVSAVKGGRLVVLPTDTVYGVGADAFDGAAVAALLAAKGRGRDMPVPVLVGSWHTIDGLVYSVPNAARELIRAFWPGALSLVVRQAPSLEWDLGDAAGTVMLRMPLHPVAIELLREVGPMAVSSANISGSARRGHRRGCPQPARRSRRGLPRRRARRTSRPRPPSSTSPARSRASFEAGPSPPTQSRKCLGWKPIA